MLNPSALSYASPALLLILPMSHLTAGGIAINLSLPESLLPHHDCFGAIAHTRVSWLSKHWLPF
ncbi:uncharacterized protein K444DRAFT_615087 [Hyaloscypha bicolor E]|uniref:Uncharacterized protein n=1 Tax=Hyaloscypha bicolor E TaxID=1095630 RepID=A0A2J6T3S0_9HELO|nr:uncharacterized protein K444DRAFT_615087 [Hyaloscypha bicolor E]PMD57691.1 hypothetical protein K444DRAFT_615087 [Hyaloscypha bicolor E]